MQATRRSFFTGLLAALCAGLCASAAEFKPRAVFYTATGERTITPIAVTARPDRRKNFDAIHGRTKAT